MHDLGRPFPYSLLRTGKKMLILIPSFWENLTQNASGSPLFRDLGIAVAGVTIDRFRTNAVGLGLRVEKLQV